ncbi:MAG: hypothetical protein KJZ93_15795 [Caldilineaceae bacterium]|nr:hypothetical protein [Caldilineaceae bacterium]
MPDRDALIARKAELRRLIEQTGRRLEAAQGKLPAPDSRLCQKLEQQLERLMAEEYQLRVAIDRARSMAG